MQSNGRKFFVVGNWKMNGNKERIDAIIKNLNAHVPSYAGWYF